MSFHYDTWHTPYNSGNTSKSRVQSSQTCRIRLHAQRICFGAWAGQASEFSFSSRISPRSPSRTNGVCCSIWLGNLAALLPPPQRWPPLNAHANINANPHARTNVGTRKTHPCSSVVAPTYRNERRTSNEHQNCHSRHHRERAVEDVHLRHACPQSKKLP